MSAPFRSLGKMLREKMLKKAATAVRVPSALQAVQSRRDMNVEQLEERRLLTTLVGGDIFEYRQANGDTVRIVLRGNVIAEAIGASIDNSASTPNNQVVRVNDLPGTFYNASKFGTQVLGGVGGEDGVELLSTISINDPLNTSGSFAYEQEGVESITIEAVASDSTGRLYGFNVVDVAIAGGTGTQRLVQLLQFDTTTQTATVIANLGPAFNTQGRFNRVEGVNRIAAADFDPISGRLFFVAEGVSVTVTTDAGGNTVITPTTNPVVQLFSVDVTLPTAAARTASVLAVNNSNFGISTADAGSIESIVFDRTTSTSTALYAIRAREDVNQLLTVNPATGAITAVQTVTFRGEDVLGITGIHIVADNSSIAEPFIYAVQGADAEGDSPSVLFINRATGAAENFGGLPDPDDDPEDGPVRGASISSLTYAEGIRNPFTGEFGVLIGVDSESDELVFIDSRNRVPQSNLFQLVITSADETAEVIMGVVPDDDPEDGEDDLPSERPMTPFSGSAGTIQVLDASGNSDDPLFLTLPEGAGGVYIGVQTVDFENTDDVDESNVPLLFGALAEQLGAVAPGQRAAGIVSTASLLLALEGQAGLVLQNKLAGQNFDNITGISVDRNGLIVAIDSDRVDENGQLIAGDQIAVIDPVTGKAGTPRLITSANLGTALSGLQAVEFADTDNNVSTPEELLAVFASQLTSSTNSGGSIGINLDNLVLSLSVTADGNTAFILATDATDSTQSRLYRSTRDSNNQFSSVVDLGALTDANGNVLTAVNAAGVRRSDSAVFVAGFNRDNPVPNQSVGGSFNNANGVNADIRDVEVTSDGATYALVAEGTSFAIYQIGRDPLTGAVTPDIPDTQADSALLPDGLRRLGTVQTGTNALQRLNAVAADPSSSTNLYGVGASATGLLPTNNLGEVSTGNSPPFTSNFIYRGLTSAADGELYSVTSSGSVLQLRRIGLTVTGTTAPGQATVVGGTSSFIRWDVNTATGAGATTAILGIRATDARPGDATGIYVLGTGADQVVPTTPVLGDLGAFNITQVSFRKSEFGQGALFSFSPDFRSTNQDVPTYTINLEVSNNENLGGAGRDTATGALFGAGDGAALPFERVGTAGEQRQGRVSNYIADARSLGYETEIRNGKSTIFGYTTGFNIDAPVPNAPLPGNLGQTFGIDLQTGQSNIRALATRPGPFGTLEEIYASIFNGTGTDIYRLQRNQTTGAISSFTKVSSDTLGLRDPSQIDPQTGLPQPINRVFTLEFDPANRNRAFFVGDVGPTSAPIKKLYTLDVANDGTVSVNNTTNPPVEIVGGGLSPLTITKALGIRPSDGAFFFVDDGDGGTIGRQIPSIPNSQLFELDPSTGVTTDYGALVGMNLGAGLPGVGGTYGANNSDIRAIEFQSGNVDHADIGFIAESTLAGTVQREKMIALDILNNGGAGGSRLIEYDFTNPLPFLTPSLVPGGVPGTGVTGVPGTVPGAIGLQSTFTDRVDDRFRTFTIDRYGRAYSVLADQGSVDRIFVSANEMYRFDVIGDTGDSDGDGFGSTGTPGYSELVSEGPLVDANGNAFFDTLDHLLYVNANVEADVPRLAGLDFIGVTSQRYQNTLRAFNPSIQPVEKLVELRQRTTNPLQVAGNGYSVVPSRQAGDVTSDGTITIAGATTENINIRGITFTEQSELIALHTQLGSDPASTADDVTSLLSLDVVFGNTGNTIRVTDPADTVLSSDPRGLTSDVLGRIYSADGNTLSQAPNVTRLLVSNGDQSLFRIDRATSIATKIANIADTAELVQQPVIDSFSAIAWRDASTLYAVQQDSSNGGTNRLVVFENVPQTATSTAITFRRVNAATTSGLIATTVDDPTTPEVVSLDISAMDFTADGRLIGISPNLRTVTQSTTQGGGSFTVIGTVAIDRQVLINYDESAGSLAPANSSFISDLGTTAGLAGLTLGGGTTPAIAGRFLSIQGNGNANDTLVSSTNNLSLFSIVAATGQATSRAVITVDGSGLADSNFVRALTHGRAGTASAGLLYAVIEDTLGDQRLFQINPTTGVAVQIGAGVITLDDPATSGVETTAARIIALSTTLAGDIVGIHDPVGSGDRRLVRLAAAVGAAVSAAGVFIAGSPAGSVSDSATGLGVDPSGRFVAVQTNGTLADQLLITPTELYQANGNPVTATSAVNFSSVASLSGVTSIGGSNVTTAVLDPIVALEFDSADRLFGVRRIPNLTPTGVFAIPPLVDNLVSINSTSGLLTSFGTIRANVATNTLASVAQIAFRSSSELYVLDNGDPTGPRVLSIDFNNGIATNAGSANVVADPSGQNVPVNPSIVGYAADGLGRFYGIDISASTDAIVVDSDGYFAASGTGVVPTSTPTLGRLLRDGTGAATGVFQEIGTLRLSNNTPLGTISAMAWSSFSQQLFVVDTNSVLYTVNPSTGVVTSTLGTITDAVTGLAVSIGSMDFDGLGRLIIQDLTNGRAAQVNFPSLQVGEDGTYFTLDGSLSASIGAISYDPDQDRFIVADNSTGILPQQNESINQPNAAAAAESALISQFELTDTAGRQDIGKIFIGGVVTGLVNIAGSIDTFYAGSILTGNAAGISRSAEFASGEFFQNFVIDGSIRQLATNSSIGTVNTGLTDIDDSQPTHLTGFNAIINGRVGSIQINGDLPGAIRINGGSIANTLTTYTPELEGRLSNDTNSNDTVGDAFARGELVYAANSNNTRPNAQRLGTFSTDTGVNSGFITIAGYIDGSAEAGDLIDYYGFSALGGETFTVSLNAAIFFGGAVVPVGFGFANGLQVGVFDPDGRLIQTSYLRNSDTDTALNFQIKATRPGEYTIAVAQFGDLNFNGIVDGVDSFVIVTDRVPYALTVATAANITLGGLNLQGNLVDMFTGFVTENVGLPDGTTFARSAQVRVVAGDAGAITATSMLALSDSETVGSTQSTTIPVYLSTLLVDAGNLRSVTANNIGQITNSTINGTATANVVEFGVGIAVPAGSVGAIRTTGNLLYLNPNALLVLGPKSTGATSPNTLLNPVGGNIQLIEAAGTLGGNIYANGAIGTIRAVDMDVNDLQSIVANADNVGQDGTIDLIDIIDQFGTLQSGGPAISTNLGGNVRYINVGGLFFRDFFFGGGSDNNILLRPGESAAITDDSGATVTIKADPRFVSPNPAFDGADPDEVDFPNLGPFINYEPYPIRSGGQVIVRMTVSQPGIIIEASSRGGRAVSAEIGSLEIQQPGDFVSPVAITESGYAGSSLTIKGSANVSIFDLDMTAVTDADVVNETKGNVPILRAGTINSLRLNGSLGFDYSLAATQPNTVLVEPLTVLTNEQPFSLQTTGAVIGATNEIRVAGAIANIIGSGDITLINANNGGVDDPAQFEGISGPIFTTGSIGQVGIGEGLAPSGAGFFQASGIFAIGDIGEVRGGANAHIRGTIASFSSIGSVITSGVISGAQVLTLAGTTAGDFIQALEIPTGTRVFLDTLDTITDPTFEVGDVRAGAGIIGLIVGGGDIRSVSAGGFGILNSRINTAGSGVIGSVVGDGYGLRAVQIDAGTNLGTLKANGNGSALPATSFSDAVRQSRFTAYDPFTGRLLTADNDLHQFLGTSESIPTISGVTESGVIEDTQAVGNGTLSTVSAFIIRGSDPDSTETTNFLNLPTGRTVLAFGNSIGNVTTKSLINGLTLTTGRLSTFSPGADVSNLDLTVSGRINAIRIKGNLVGGSNIASVGPSAGINSLKVDGNFFGSLTSQGRIGTIDVKGNIGALNDDGTPILDTNGNRVGVIVIDPATNLRGGQALSKLKVGGSVVSGSLTLGSATNPINVGSIEVAGSLGNAGETLTVNGNLNSLKVGTARNTLASLNLNFIVTGSAKSIDVQGRVAGSVQVFGNLSSLKVTNDNPSDLGLINGGLTVNGSLSKVDLLGGNLASVLTVTGNLGTLNIRNGSIGSTGSVVVQNGGITNLNIVNGNIAGTVSAAGRINKLSATAIGDNASPNSTITAASAGRVTVANDIFSDTSISIAGRFDSLTVNGNVAAGATINAGSFGTVRVKGTNNGTYTPPLV